MSFNRYLAAAAAAVLALSWAGCGEKPAANDDAGPGGNQDAGLPPDGGPEADGGTPDAGPVSCTPASLPSLDQGSWDPQFTLAGFTRGDGITPRAYDFTTDPDGNVLATGSFTYVDGQRMPPLVARENNLWLPARSSWELPLPASGFSAVAESSDGKLALATYDDFGQRNGQVWLDSGSGLTVIGHYAGLVRRVAWFDGKLWVAGNFRLDELTTSPGLVVWNGTEWESPPGGSADGPVFELVVDGNELLVGGDFNNLGGIAARAVAGWDGSTWTPYSLDLAAGSVYALGRDSTGELYAGGSMFNDWTTGLGGLAHWNGSHWELVGGGISNGTYPGVISSIANFNGKLYVAGCFKSLGARPTDTGAVPATAMARWNGTGWEAVAEASGSVASSWFNPGSCGDEGADAIWDVNYQRLFVDGNRLLLAGAFGGLGNVASESVIAYDGEKFVAMGNAGAGVSGEVSDLAVGGPDCAMYGVGNFSHAGGKIIRKVAKYENGWSAVGDTLPNDASCSEVEATRGGDVYVGCTTFSDNGPPVGAVYRLDGDKWAAVGGTLPEGLVMDLAVDPQDNVWVAGGAQTGYLAKIENGTFTVVENRFDSIVMNLAFRQGTDPAAPAEYVVAGGFQKIGNEAFNRIARWDGSGWKALGAGLNATPSALEYGVDAVYASTQFEGDPSRFILGKWNGSSWEELGTPANGLPAPMGQSVHTFLALREVGGKLLAAGYVWPKTGGRNVYVYDGEKFTAIGGGANAIMVSGLAIAPEGLWFGGSIADVGLMGETAIPSNGVALYRWDNP